MNCCRCDVAMFELFYSSGLVPVRAGRVEPDAVDASSGEVR